MRLNEKREAASEVTIVNYSIVIYIIMTSIHDIILINVKLYSRNFLFFFKLNSVA